MASGSSRGSNPLSFSDFDMLAQEGSLRSILRSASDFVRASISEKLVFPAAIRFTGPKDSSSFQNLLSFLLVFVA